MEALLVSLRVCNRSIEPWNDSLILHVAGTKESALSYWYGLRDNALAGIRAHRYWRYGTPR